MKINLKYSFLLLFVIALNINTITAQNAETKNANVATASTKVLALSRSYVDTLTSPFFWGRGYTNDGMGKAAKFLQNEFRLMNLKSFKKSTFLQEFEYDVNTFPGKMEVSVNGKALIPGEDFIVAAQSKSMKANYELMRAESDSNVYLNIGKEFVLKTVDKLTWSVADMVAPFTVVEVLKSSIQNQPKYIKLDVEQKLLKNFEANNVIGYVRT